MRSACLILLSLGLVAARRTPVVPVIVPSPRAITAGLDLGTPYYPFGWGLDDSYFGVPEEFQIHTDDNQGSPVGKMKDVKREVDHHNVSDALHQKTFHRPGWFEMPANLAGKARRWIRSSHLQEVEDALDGLE